MPAAGPVLVLGCLCLALTEGAFAASPSAPAQPASPQLVKSEFIDDPNFGRDPFFPITERRKANRPNTNLVQRVVFFSKLRLQGVSGSKDKPLAIINNRTFETGEEAELRVDAELVKVRCVEIKAQSALVSVNGQRPQELFLGQRF